MKRKTTIILISLLLFTLFAAGAVSAEAVRVAVIGFESEDPFLADNREKEEELLEEIAWLFNDKLAESEEYIVLDRKQMLDMLDRVNYTRGKRPTHSIINQLRNFSKADQFIYGKLEKVDVQKLETFRIGPIRFADVAVTVNLSVEMVNARTARVTDTYYGSGSTAVSGVYMGDTWEEGLKFNLFSDENILNRAIRRAVNNLVENIIDEKDELVERTVEAEIVSIVKEKLVVNKGERDGLKVAKTGEIVRYLTRDSGLQLVVIGEAEVTEVDRNSAFLKVVYLNQQPEVGDKVVITVKEVEDKDPIKVLETRDFTIKITEAVIDGDRVTIKGMAYAEADSADLELILGNRDFYDHEGKRRDMSGRRVSIGGWISSSSRIASIKENIQKGEPEEISWSFTGVPEKADKLARIELWLRTAYEGGISFDLRDLKLESN